VTKEHLLALDQGTSSSRAIVFHASGRIVAMVQREFRQIYPQPGWVEHDANEIWDTQLAVAREALAKAHLKAGDIAAIGITNQRETAAPSRCARNFVRATAMPRCCAAPLA
jgi:glycerol kinase